MGAIRQPFSASCDVTVWSTLKITALEGCERAAVNVAYESRTVKHCPQFIQVEGTFVLSCH